MHAKNIFPGILSLFLFKILPGGLCCGRYHTLAAVYRVTDPGSDHLDPNSELKKKNLTRIRLGKTGYKYTHVIFLKKKKNYRREFSIILTLFLNFRQIILKRIINISRMKTISKRDAVNVRTKEKEKKKKEHTMCI